MIERDTDQNLPEPVSLRRDQLWLRQNSRPQLEFVVDNKTVAQLLLRWALEKGYAIIPKSATHSRIEQNFALDFTISEEDMKVMNGLDQKMFCCWNNAFDPSSVE